MRNRAIAAIFAISFIAGCDRAPLAQPSGENKPGAATPLPVGRFVIVHSPHIERDTMLLDTVTGRTWQLAETSKHDELWQPIFLFNNQPIPLDVPTPP